MLPSTVPFGRTARRLEWAHLPPSIRAVVEQRIGSPVVDTVTQTSGFTPGFASVLTTAAGTRHFVKPASVRAQRAFAAAYLEEARKLAGLPVGVPAPRLLWLHDADDWVVLETEYVEGRLPHRPWRAAELDATLDLLEQIADLLTPPPAGLDLDGFAEHCADWPAFWDHVRAADPDRPGLPGLAEHLDEAAGLAAAALVACAGDTVVHGDVRDDNVLLRPDGTAVVCDWNFPDRGAAWIDTLVLMIGPRGDGLDVDAVLAGRRLTRDVPAGDLDAVIALVTGYFLRQADEQVPSTSPHLRDFQRWQGEVCWAWLAERRGWSAGPGRVAI